MEPEAISPGTASGETSECESAEEKVAGTDNCSASEDHDKNTDHVGCGTPDSKEKNAASYVKLQSLQTLDQLLMGRKYTTFQMSPLSVPASLGCSDSSANQGDFGRSSDGSAADMDCLVCFNRYSCSRPPKVLACHHVFCAVCLKLMLRNEDNAWRIICPVCRKVTTVFGGLICGLPNKVGIGHLADPGPNAEMHFSPDALSGTLVIHSTFSISQGEEHSNRVAAKRLLFLILLLMSVMLFVLPFLYGGLLTWTLCFAVILGLIVAGTGDMKELHGNHRARLPENEEPSWQQEMKRS
uniref:Uncharacterized protein n=1 Tax=Sphaerodactylus townsendi TaxID=933632 RepID=A0ACB8EEU1_9SAUR